MKRMEMQKKVHRNALQAIHSFDTNDFVMDGGCHSIVSPGDMVLVNRDDVLPVPMDFPELSMLGNPVVALWTLWPRGDASTTLTLIWLSASPSSVSSPNIDDPETNRSCK